MRAAIARAQRSVFILGWDIDSKIRLVPGGANDGYPEELGDFLNEVVKRNPHHFVALSGKAQIHILLGHPEHALEAYERAVRINPNLPDAEENLKVLRQAVDEKKSKTV